MPGIDKPTGRVVALIVLMIVVAAALRGYLPAQGHAVRSEPGSGRAALIFVIVALSGTLALLAVAIIARLRDPHAVAPNQGDLSEMLGTDKFRPNWRVKKFAEIARTFRASSSADLLRRYRGCAAIRCSTRELRRTCE